ncbi:MAG: hypothetical protein HOO67_05375 [Candidatus Peribacteraceae bacterium]|nr:hypothetical protein [Candidatus Peribacteraceae bacterium]
MKFFTLGFIITGICLSMHTTALAHPGNTAADGCHFCRTNCSKWGVPWNERHCHNAKPTPKPVTPVATKKAPVDPCSQANLLATYKAKKATGESMNNLSAKNWWTQCPASVRAAVYKLATP